MRLRVRVWSLYVSGVDELGLTVNRTDLAARPQHVRGLPFLQSAGDLGNARNLPLRGNLQAVERTSGPMWMNAKPKVSINTLLSTPPSFPHDADASYWVYRHSRAMLLEGREEFRAVLGRAHYDSCCGIGMGSTDRTSGVPSRRWASKRS